MNTLLLLFSYFPSSFRSRASSRETFSTSNGASLSLSYPPHTSIPDDSTGCWMRMLQLNTLSKSSLPQKGFSQYRLRQGFFFFWGGGGGWGVGCIILVFSSSPPPRW